MNWTISLALFLLLYGILQITNIRFELQGFLLGALAILTAVLILFSNRRAPTP